MSDVKDILGMPRGGAGNDKPEQKEKKEKMKRPEGMSREAFALLGSVHPIIPSHIVDGFKRKADAQQKPKASTKGVITYQWKAFKNPARNDDLQLSHWVKGYKDASGRVRDAEEGDYSFAKFNKKVQVYRYDDEEWNNIVRDDTSGWSRQETDYLLEMCEQFDLRWVVIGDRYEFPGGPRRTLEDLKERYYRVARRLLVEREGGEVAASHHIIVKHPYDKQYEMSRKAALNILLTRNLRQDQDDQMVLEQARQIEERRRQEMAQKRANAHAAAAAAASAPPAPPAPASTSTPDQTQPFSMPARQPGASSLFNADLTQFKPPKPGVYARGAFTLKQGTDSQESAATGARDKKNLEQELTTAGALTIPDARTRATCYAWLALRADVISLMELRKTAPRTDEGKGKLKRKR